MSVSEIHNEDSVFAELTLRDAEAATEHGRELARLWSHYLDRIIDRVFEVSEHTGRVAWHIAARTEMVFELARLSHWLTARILDHRLKGRSVLAITLEDENQFCCSPQGEQLIENTATIVAERIWNRIYDDLHQKYPLVETFESKRSDPRLRRRTPKQRAPEAKDNHFVPRFTIEPWADRDRQVREFYRSARQQIATRLRPCTQWGFEPLLYPPVLERHFQKIESRAAGPYRKIPRYLPLTPEDRYFWIYFLILQYLRTPKFMAAIASGLREQIIRNGWDYPETPEAMKRAYLTLFGETSVLSFYYLRLNKRRWHQLKPIAGMSFARTDAPVVFTGGVNGEPWQGFYPLTPQSCFMIGPELAEADDVPFALSQRLTSEQTVTLNRLLIQHARRSIVVRTADDSNLWRSMVEDALAHRSTRTEEEYRAWGPL